MTSRSRALALLAGGIIVAGGAVYLLVRRGNRSLLGDGDPHEREVEIDGYKLTAHRQDHLPIKERVAILQDLTAKSIRDPRMRKVALKATRRCKARDANCEARAIYDWIKKNIRYTGDIGPHALWAGGPVEGVDLFQAAHRTVEFGGGDCLPAGTLLWVEGNRLVPIEDVLPGSKIWGRDQWTEVQDVWAKGTLPVDAVQLNNGSWFKATGDHKIYVAKCPSHPVKWDSGASCSCPVEKREIVRIPLSEAEPGMVLIAPERIPYGSEEQDPDRAFVEGLYLADGWRSHEFDFDIAGRDGHPKEAQKHQVKEICDRLGLETTWFAKSIRVRDVEWSRRLAAAGDRAPEKHALSLDLDRDASRALLRGMMADSDERGVLTTTSRLLAIQARMLHKMQGITCGESFIAGHGGLGKNPIWRITRRRSDGGYSSKKFLRIRAIERAVEEAPVYDISTSDHYVYLPEADVTVSNCDDHSILACTMAALNGLHCKYRVTSPRRGRRDDYSHIYAMIGLPKMRPKKWVAVDTTLPGRRFGFEAPHKKRLDFPA